MKAEDLRIGNYYDNNGRIEKVTPNTIIDVWESERTWCNPIPLTEEWLLKFGFNFDADIIKSDEQVFRLKGIALSQSAYNWHVHKYVVNDPPSTDGMAFILVSVKYVHQLQNLYFALTSNELTIK